MSRKNDDFTTSGKVICSAKNKSPTRNSRHKKELQIHGVEDGFEDSKRLGGSGFTVLGWIDIVSWRCYDSLQQVRLIPH